MSTPCGCAFAIPREGEAGQAAASAMKAAVGREGVRAIRLPPAEIPHLAAGHATPVRVLVDCLGGGRQVATAARRAVRRRRRSILGFVTRVHHHSSALRADRNTRRDRRGGQRSGKLCYEQLQYTRSAPSPDKERGGVALSVLALATSVRSTRGGARSRKAQGRSWAYAELDHPFWHSSRFYFGIEEGGTNETDQFSGDPRVCLRHHGPFRIPAVSP